MLKNRQNHHLVQLKGVKEHPELTHLLGRQGKREWLIVRQLFIKADKWDAPLTLWDLAEATYIIPKVALSNSFLWLEEVLRRSFPALLLEILDSPCLLFLFICTNDKYYKMKSWTDPTSSFPWRRTHPLGG